MIKQDRERKKKLEKLGISGWLLTASQKEIDECICAEWDGKGWSTCGFPCSVHNRLAHQPKKLAKYLKVKK